MSINATTAVWKHSPFREDPTCTMLIIHLKIADVVNPAHNFEFWMSQENVAAATCTSVRSVNRFMKRAVACGALDLLEDNAKEGKPNRYRFNFPEPAVRQDDAPAAVGSATESAEVRQDDTTARPRGAPGYAPVAHKTEDQDRNRDGRGNNTHPPSKLGAADESSTTLRVPSEDHRDQVDSQSSTERAEVEVFDAWVAATGRDPARTRLTTSRRDLIKARISEGYTAETLIAAVHGLTKSAFHMGQNDRRMQYDDLRYAIASGEKVESFERLAMGEGEPMDSTGQAMALLTEMGFWDDRDSLEAGSERPSGRQGHALGDRPREGNDLIELEATPGV